jgi:pimeloyl-ACP methyl ester carboxylesterase
LSSDTRQRHPLALAFVRDGLMRSDPQAYARTCEALAEAQPAAVDRITAPVLLVTGDEDAVAPPQGVRGLADRLHASAGVRTVVLPRCGHWTPLERADDCMREWLDFMAAVARRPRQPAGVAAH